MKLVIIESPYKGDTPRNLRYLRSCIRDCLSRNESPYASHRMLTDALDDDSPAERALGIEAGLAWRDVYQPIKSNRGAWTMGFDRVRLVFYIDLGWSEGMVIAKSRYDEEAVLYEERNLRPDDLFFKEVAPTLPPPARDHFVAETLAGEEPSVELGMAPLSPTPATTIRPLQPTLDETLPAFHSEEEVPK